LDTKHSLVDYLLIFFFVCLVVRDSGKGSSGNSSSGKGSSSVSSSGKRSSSISSSGKRSSGISSSGDMGSGNSGSSSGITNMLKRLLDTDDLLGDSVDWGVDGSDDLLGRVGGVGGVVDVRGLHDLLDGVDLVGGCHRDGTGDSDLIGGSHVLVDDDLTGNRGWHVDRHVNVVLLHIDLGNDVGGLGGDPDVRPHGSEDLLLGDGVSRGRAQVPGCSGDGGLGGDHGEGWGGNGHGDSGVLGGASDIGSSGLGHVLNSGNSVLVAGHHALDSGLHHVVPNHSVLGVLLDCGGSCGIGLVALAHHGGGGDHGSASIGASSRINTRSSHSRASGVQASLGGGDAHADSHEGEHSHKSVHLG